MPEEVETPNPEEKIETPEPGDVRTLKVENPNAGEAETPDIAKEYAPSRSEAVATDLPTADMPDQKPTSPEPDPEAAEASEDTPAAGAAKRREAAAVADPAQESISSGETSKSAERKKPARAAKADGDSPVAATEETAPRAAKAKKEKPPAIEDKPFAEFINQDFLTSLKQTLAKQGIQDLDLKFEKRSLPVRGFEEPECWQIIGHWQGGQRQFIIGFLKEDIQGSKVFCCADNGARPSILESFMIDERKVNLDLMLLYTTQRLNGQKWLVRN